MARGIDVDPAVEEPCRVLANPEATGPVFRIETWTPVPRSSKAHRVGQPLDRVFRRDIGRPPAQRCVPDDRGMHHDAPVPLRDHPRQGKTRELMHAEDVRREDQFQRLARNIFGRAGHAVAAVVEQRVERPPVISMASRQPSFDAGRIAVVDPDAVKAVGLPRGHVLVACGRRR
jgi:hypothetical protein